MCIICIKEKGVAMPTETTIRTMFNNNPDGAGFMYWREGMDHVTINKGYMDVEAFISAINAVTNIHACNINDCVVVMHFRISTSGLVDMGNCHPYPVSRKVSELRATNLWADMGLAHNGILHDFTPEKSSVLNDTQTFIKELVAGLKKPLSNVHAPLFERLTAGNRIVMLDGKGKIVKYGDWKEVNGLYYSNDSYECSRWNVAFNTGYAYGWDGWPSIDPWEWLDVGESMELSHDELDDLICSSIWLNEGDKYESFNHGECNGVVPSHPETVGYLLTDGYSLVKLDYHNDTVEMIAKDVDIN